MTPIKIKSYLLGTISRPFNRVLSPKKAKRAFFLGHPVCISNIYTIYICTYIIYICMLHMYIYYTVDTRSLDTQRLQASYMHLTYLQMYIYMIIFSYLVNAFGIHCFYLSGCLSCTQEIYSSFFTYNFYFQMKCNIFMI